MTVSLDAAFTRRVAPGLAVAEAAEQIAHTCRNMAARFHRGGRLLTFGTGAAAADAAHLAVEFVHPVLVGKRALPAMSLANDPVTLTGLAGPSPPDQVFADQLRLFGQPVDIAVAIAAGPTAPEVRAGLAAAAQLGLLTVALTTEPEPADHPLPAHTDDPLVAREVHVTTYHILWELVHVFLDRPDLLAHR